MPLRYHPRSTVSDDGVIDLLNIHSTTSTKTPLVIAANRLPVRYDASGGRWVLSPGGLTRALIPASAHRPATWIGWPGVAGPIDTPRSIAELGDSVSLVGVRLDTDEIEAFYDGFANRTLWPLLHDGLAMPELDDDWWATYRRVNERFADTLIAQAPTGADVWIHDYHLLLVPAMVRAARPDVRIGAFLHTPFPAPEVFARLPWRSELINGLLGADVIGMQTPTAADNLRRAADSIVGTPANGQTLALGDRTVDVVVRPVAVDVHEITSLMIEPSMPSRIAAWRQQLGDGRRILLGVDRLDYTKGIDARLDAFGALLAEQPELADDLVLVQVAVPSRTDVAAYVAERERVERAVGEINGRFAGLGHPVVRYLYDSLDLDELVALYGAADVMLVTPRSDGMNLVAKEFVASRRDGDGVLVLSEFAGAAAELLDAVQVNPFDRRGMVEALRSALSMRPAERHRRMHRLRRRVEAWDVHTWTAALTDDLARARPKPVVV
jgi:alpha,alpha-trehalose-phosphate synthase [UDP-forming]